MSVIVKEIEVSVEDFDIIDIIREIQNRGYKVINSNGISAKKQNLQEELEHLYDTYRTCSSEMFERELEQLFRNYVI